MTPSRQLAASAAVIVTMLGGSIGGLAVATAQPARSAIVNHRQLPAGWRWIPAGTHNGTPCIGVYHKPRGKTRGATAVSCEDGWAGTS